MDWLTRELRVALRVLRRRRSYTVSWIANYSIGICGFAVVYSVVAQSLLRPLPYPAAERLVATYQAFPELRGRMPARWDSFGFSYAAFRALERDVPAFEAVAALAGGSRVLTSTDDTPPERVDLLRVSTSVFDVLGVRPVRGRSFLAGEDAVPGTPVALISFEMWSTRFGSSETILEQSLTLDGVDHRVVGVLPRDFRLPRATTPRIWIPIGGEADDTLPRKTPLSLVARLRDGADADMARTQASRVLAALDPGQQRGARVTSWQNEITKNSRRPLIFLFTASLILLALATVSSGGLTAIEFRSRLRELATRMAIGASRRRILTALCVEVVLLSISAVVVGAWLATAVLAALRAVATAAVPGLQYASIDIGVISAAAAIAIITSVVIAIIVGTMVSSRAPVAYLATAFGSGRRSIGDAWTTNALVALQFGMATLLLIGGSLLTVNLRRMSNADPGFDPRRRIVASIEVGPRASDPAVIIPLFNTIADRVRRLPHVREVAVGSAIPFSGGNSNGEMAIESERGADTITARFSSALPGFLETLGLRLGAGRTIAEADGPGADPVAVVNATIARRYWPDGSAIGRHLTIGETRFTVVGVVSDVRHASPIDSTWPTVYVAEQQKHSRFLQLLIRVGCEKPAGRSCEGVSLGSLRKAVAEVAPTVVVNSAEPMSTLVARTFAADRFRTWLITLFAGVAIALTLFGAYGTTARAIQLARGDIAIRLALGATNAVAIRRLARDLGIVAATGALGGAVASVWASGVVRPFLALVSASDPFVYVAATSCLTLVAVLTAAFAARAVTRIDPAAVLRGG